MCLTCLGSFHCWLSSWVSGLVYRSCRSLNWFRPVRRMSQLHYAAIIFPTEIWWNYPLIQFGCGLLNDEHADDWLHTLSGLLYAIAAHCRNHRSHVEAQTTGKHMHYITIFHLSITVIKDLSAQTNWKYQFSVGARLEFHPRNFQTKSTRHTEPLPDENFVKEFGLTNFHDGVVDFAVAKNENRFVSARRCRKK